MIDRGIAKAGERHRARVDGVAGVAPLGRGRDRQLFAGEKHKDTVGAFEGAMYEAKGYYRPEVDCIMFSRNQVPFCDVCSGAIEKVIDLYSR